MPHLAYTDEELDLRPGWDVDPDSNQPLSPRIREQLRRSIIAEHENDDLKAKLAVIERREAFRKVGIPADARGDLFAKGNPDLADETEIKNAWEATFGPLEAAPAGADTTGTPAADPATEAARRVADAAAAPGGQGGAPGDVPFERGMEDAWEQGGNEGLKAFIREHGEFSTPVTDEDGRLVRGIKLPDVY